MIKKVMKHGDFIKIDFIGKVEGTGKVFDFTQEKIAKEEGIHDPKKKYEPVLVVIGANMVIPGVEKELMKMKEAEENSFSVEFKDAFGPRNPKLARIFSLSSFLKQKINPIPGDFVRVEGLQGKVQSVSGGRVRVDFNHPLAGKDLHYWIKIVSVIQEKGKKVDELFAHYDIKHTHTLHDNVLTITGEKEIPQQERNFIRETVVKWVKGIESVNFSAKGKSIEITKEKTPKKT